MDQLVGMMASGGGLVGGDSDGSTAPDDASSQRDGSEADDGMLRWEEDVEGQSLPLGIFAGASPERVKSSFVELRDAIAALGRCDFCALFCSPATPVLPPFCSQVCSHLLTFAHFTCHRAQEGDDDPATNPWVEAAPKGLRARMQRKAAESQKPLYEEAFDDYRAEIEAAREKAASEEMELTEHMELMAGVNGAHEWWESRTAAAAGKSFMAPVGASVLGGGGGGDVAKRAKERAERIARKLLADVGVTADDDTTDGGAKKKAASKWDTAKVATKKKTEASKDHAKVAAKAWRRNAKLAKPPDPFADPMNLSLLREHALPPLMSAEGAPIYGEHPALGLLPTHVLKHVTTKAGLPLDALGQGHPEGVGVFANAPPPPAAEKNATKGKPVKGAAAAAAVPGNKKKASAAPAPDVAAQQQGRTVRKVHNREALAAMSEGNWEERIQYLQYELKRPPSAGAGANSAQAVGKTSRYRRWGRLGATTHLNQLNAADLADGGDGKKREDGRKKRDPRKAALPDVAVVRKSMSPARVRGGQRARGARRRGGRGAGDTRDPGAGNQWLRKEDQRVLTAVYLGEAELEVRSPPCPHVPLTSHISLTFLSHF